MTDTSPHLVTSPRGDGDPVVKRQAKRVNVVVEEEHRVHRPAQPAEVLDAQVVVPEAGVAVQARGEELAGGVEQVDDGVGVGLSGGRPDYELFFFGWVGSGWIGWVQAEEQRKRGNGGRG